MRALAGIVLAAALAAGVFSCAQRVQPVEAMDERTMMGMSKESVAATYGTPDRTHEVPPVRLSDMTNEWCLTPLLWTTDAPVRERWTYLLEKDDPFGPRMVVAFDAEGRVVMTSQKGQWPTVHP